MKGEAHEEQRTLIPARPWTAGKLVALSAAFWQACTLQAAVKLDLFTRLGDRVLDEESIARELGAAPRGVSMLLTALTAMELLTCSDGKYANTPESKTLLSRDSDRSVVPMILHHRNFVDSWNQLDQAITSGRPVPPRVPVDVEDFVENFARGMGVVAALTAPAVAEALDLSGRRRLLDLGGGPGTYAIHFCRKYPGLHATVFDLPTTRPFAEEAVRKAGLEDRIEFQEGNFHHDPVEGTHDVAWLSQILHGEGPEGCRVILDRAMAALEPGGLLVVHDFLLNDDRKGPLFPAIFSLNMLLATPEGRTYTEGEVRAMMERAGARDVRRLPFRGPAESGLLVGRV